MRLAIRFALEREGAIPLSHQDLLTGLVYGLLGASDTEYARFLHDEGYRLEEGRPKQFKLFVFSNLRVPANRRRIEGEKLWLAPGPVEWFLGSPREDFLTHSAVGLLTAGAEVRVGSLPLTIAEVRTLPAPELGPETRFTCLTPMVASVPREDRSTEYLRPADGMRFSEAVRRNLLLKYELLYGGAPEDDRLTLTFDAKYLARDAHGGTKKIRYKEIDVVGALAPFTLAGSTALMRVGYDAGFGEKNGGGFGMAEVVSSQ